MAHLVELLSSPEARGTVFLVLVLLLPILWTARAMRHGQYTPLQWFFLFIVILLVRVRWRARVPPWPLPPGQGALVVANHRSSIDPFFIQIVTRRPVHWMVAREYCEHPALAWFLRLAEAIPTNRSGIDTAATKSAIRLAADGGLVGMFPEGRINMTSELLLPGRPGAVLVALRARVPLLPCYIAGSPYHGSAFSPLTMRARVSVRFGTPIDLSPYYNRAGEDGLMEKLLLQAMSAIASLAGRDDFRPRLAGRRWRPTTEEVQRAAAALREQGPPDLVSSPVAAEPPAPGNATAARLPHDPGPQPAR